MTDELLRFRIPTGDSSSLCCRSTFQELVRELRRRADTTERGRHAALALDALDVFKSGGNPGETPPSAHRGALTWSTIEPLVLPLGDLADHYDGTCWCDLVIALLDLVPVADRKPALVLQLALYAPPEARAVLLAEYWHLLMIGARHTALSTLVIALDVWGRALSTPRSCLAKTLAAASRRVPTGSPWVIQTPDDTIVDTDSDTDHHELARAALQGLADIPEEFDFVTGWGLVQLRVLLARAGLHEETLAVAQGLSNRLGARNDALHRLTRKEEPNTRTARTGRRTGRLWIETGTAWGAGARGTGARGTGARGAETMGDSAIQRVKAPCDFGAFEQEVPVFIGQPARGYHPLHFQNILIRATRGGSIQPEIMTGLDSAYSL